MATHHPLGSQDLDRTLHNGSSAQSQCEVVPSSTRQPRLRARLFSTRLSPRAVAAIRLVCLGEALVFATLGVVFHSWAGFQAAALLMVLGSGNLALARQERSLSSPRPSGPADPGSSPDSELPLRADREADFYSWRVRRVAALALLAALFSLAVSVAAGAIGGITHSAPVLGIATSPGDVLQSALCTGIGASLAPIHRVPRHAIARYAGECDPGR